MSRKGYEAEQQIFAHWLSLTKDEQMEEYGCVTQRDMAKYLKLPHEKLLSEWKANPKFQKIHQKMIYDTFKDLIPQARKAIAMRGVVDGDVQALKEIFKVAGISIERVENVSNSDIEEVIKAVVKVANDVLAEHKELLTQFVEGLEDELGEL